jgi:hypothetical protein
MHLLGNKNLVLSIAINVMLAFALSMLIYLVYPQFIYELDSVSKWTRYRVRTYRNYEGGVGYFEILMGPKEYLRQPQVPRRIYSYSGKQAFYVETIGAQMTGNGVPNLVISQWEGSAHGDSRYLVFEIDGSVVKKIDVIDGLLDATFGDLNNDGIDEITGVDGSYSYFLGDSHAASPRPSVVLSFAKTQAKFVPDKKLMSKPPLSDDQLNELGLKYKNDPRWSKEFRPPSELFDTMLELIYSGNEKQAWEVLDASWSDVSKIPKQECKEALEENLRESPFYPVIADWNKEEF